ncbi:MAG: hypothetical protein WBC16_06695 [Candidatus Omnitrophota bacterium]
MILASAALMVLTFININVGLIAILLSMLLSPELEIGAVAGRAVIIRAEDVILIVVILAWLAKMAVQKGLYVIRTSPLNAPIGLYIAILCISTLRGMVFGNVSPYRGTFYVLKLFEYFILYFMVLNHTTTTRQVKMFLFFLLLTCTIVGIYGNTHIGQVARISAPFEGEGEPNTLGGYLLFIMSIMGGLILYYKKRRNILFLLFLFLIPTFLFTLSRSSYLGMIPALIIFALLSRNRKVVLGVLVVLCTFVVLVGAGPPIIQQRVLGAFQPEAQQRLKQVGPVKLGPSPAARVISWQKVFTYDFPRRPFLGLGMTGGAFLDSQYVLALQETGIIGLAIFLWLILRIWKSALNVYNTVETPLFKGLALGYLAGFVGLLFQAIGTNTFIIIRIAEPFWFFTAIIMKMKDIETGRVVTETIPSRFPIYRGPIVQRW